MIFMGQLEFEHLLSLVLKIYCYFLGIIFKNFKNK